MTHAGGRPTSFTKELGDRICDQLAEGLSLRSVCKADDMPDKSTVFRWIRDDKEFQDQYARAKREGADAMAEDILDIIDDGTNDWMTIQGNRVTNREAIERSKLRFQGRQWLMSKTLPKKYGDKIDMTTNGKDLPTPILGGLSRTKNINDDIKDAESAE